MWTVTPQTSDKNSFQSNSLPLKTESKMDITAEAKSTSSDKENESLNTPPKMNNVNGQNGHGRRSGAGDYKPDIKANGVDTQMEVDEKPDQSFASVHELLENRKKCHWSYYSTGKELDMLIESLNPRGFREGQLKQSLIDMKSSIVNNIDKCPVHMLTITKDKQAVSEAKMGRYQNAKSKNRISQGTVENDSAQELLELNLREMLLDMEERVFAGALGALKVSVIATYRCCCFYSMTFIVHNQR